MQIFKRLARNTNAGLIKRSLALCMDMMCAGFFRAIILQIVFFTRSRAIFLDFFEKFDTAYPGFNLAKIHDYEALYITSSRAFREFLLLIIIGSCVGFIYNLFNFVFFKDGTIGQRIMSLKVVNNRDDSQEKLAKWQIVLKSFLSSVVFVIFFDIVLFSGFNFLKLGKYTHTSSKFISFFAKVINVSNVYNAFLYSMFIILFWFNLFFFSNRFFLHDIITCTRVVDTQSVYFSKDATSISDGFINMFDRTLNIVKRLWKRCFGSKDL